MHIVDWFNIHDVDHLTALRTLDESGAWPPGFLPNHVDRPWGWRQALTAKLADAWIDTQLAVCSQADI